MNKYTPAIYNALGLETEQGIDILLVSYVGNGLNQAQRKQIEDAMQAIPELSGWVAEWKARLETQKKLLIYKENHRRNGGQLRREC